MRMCNTDQAHHQFWKRGYYSKIMLNESLLLLIYQLIAVNSQWPMTGCKNQLIKKMSKKVSVPNIFRIEIMVYIQRLTAVNILG